MDIFELAVPVLEGLLFASSLVDDIDSVDHFVVLDLVARDLDLIDHMNIIILNLSQ